ncbi:unnamed protein product [Rotaria sp. Silwood2]|nr:unnamed protein product [Rotaria sp. Silwood2]CAF4160133.1 unnamed protein product [Rotaria sp. Silwood2]CAF4303512.1 unnamed protein product [Rotaria sp. Silwood2]
MQVLHSLMGVNMRLSKIIRDPIFTGRLTFVKWSFNKFIDPLSDTIVDRFCRQILPQIHHNVKWLDVEPLSMGPIFLAGKYPNLYGLGIYNIREGIIQRLCHGKKFNFSCFYLIET